MVDLAARVVAGRWIVDAGRCTREADSGGATAAFSGCRSGAARRWPAAARVVGSTIQ
jgi:hypothetical protein